MRDVQGMPRPDAFRGCEASDPAGDHMDKSPIPYWVAKKNVWPRLGAMALDMYPVPAMSDEAERIFSYTGHIVALRRRSLTNKPMEQLMRMESWLEQGIAQLDRIFWDGSYDRLLKHNSRT